MIEQRGREAGQLHGVAHSTRERELAIEAVERELHLPVGRHPDAVEAAEATPETDEPRSRWHWVGRLVLLMMIGGGLGAGIIALYRFADGPASGTVKSFAAAEASAAPKPTSKTPNSLAGLYVEMQYLPQFDQISQLKTTAPSLEDYMLSTESSLVSQRISMAVEVRTLASRNLEDDPSYLMRKEKPTVYTPSAVKLAGESATLMTGVDHNEETLFWAHGSQELTVAITSAGGDTDTIDAAMKLVLATARWRS